MNVVPHHTRYNSKIQNMEHIILALVLIEKKNHNSIKFENLLELLFYTRTRMLYAML